MGKISDQTALTTTLATGDLITIVDISDTSQAASGTSKKMTMANFFANIVDAITTTGNISGAIGAFTGLLDISGAGAGNISFPATQNINAGANILDDYEEGTWTPVLSDGTNNATHTIQEGTYVKVGKLVNFKGRILISSLESVSGAIRVTGLPFTSAADANSFGVVNFGFGSGLAINAGTNVVGFVAVNAAHFTLNLWSITTGTGGMSGAQWSADGGGIFTGTYYV